MEEDIKNLSEKFNLKLKKELDYGKTKTFASPIVQSEMPKAPQSSDYHEFKKAFMPKPMTYYEKLCNLSEKILNIKPSEKEKPLYDEAIATCHLDMTSTGAISFSILAPLLMFLGGTFIFGIILPLIFTGEILYFFIMFFLVVAFMIYMPIKQLPMFMANNWRMKASSQMVLSVFYVVTYMRHTSNLELAIEFASQHLAAPLSLDFRKILWDVVTQKYPSMRESLDAYLVQWRKDNLEFVEAMHLVEGSLMESDEARRLSMLDKSLSVMLEETYEKMLHYSQNLQAPISMLNMLGIVLPILGLVILPLVVSFMSQIRWYHIATLYNVFLPIVIFYLGKTILASRPSGYGSTDISKNPALQKKQGFTLFGNNMKASSIAILIAVVCLFIGFSPLIINMINPAWDFGLISEGQWGVKQGIGGLAPEIALLDYKCLGGAKTCDADELIGPFGIGATLLSIAVTIASGISLGLYYKLKSSNVMKVRDDSKKLEKEFASALFQLGNVLGDGLPAEMAFGKVATNMEGTISGKFFEIASSNVRRLGMSVDQAIFDTKLGALAHFPSDLIASSMKVMTESVKKGPKIAAQALINISQYIKEMHRVNERLKDLMAESLASIQSQIKFLTPAIAGIVIGITSMVTTIIGKLTVEISKTTEGTAAAQYQAISDMFKQPNVPPYYFQIIVGLYVVQIIYILTVLANGIENGNDKLSERYQLGKNLIKSVTMYCVLSFIVILVFNAVAGMVM